jgi:hypothetical protein
VTRRSSRPMSMTASFPCPRPLTLRSAANRAAARKRGGDKPAARVRTSARRRQSLALEIGPVISGSWQAEGHPEARNAYLQVLCLFRLGHGLGHEGDLAPGRTTRSAHLQALQQDGSDGTRTRDLRRDRPKRAWRRTSTDRSERPHLQVLSALRLPPLRMVEPIVQSTFWAMTGPRNLVLRDNNTEHGDIAIARRMRWS